MGVFRAFASTTDTIAATTTSAGGALSNLTGNPPVFQVRVYNAGSATAFIRFGVGAQTAVATDIPVPSGAVEVFTTGGTHWAAITSSGSATIYATTGLGE